MAVTASDFPQLCESCLGSSPYVKMQRIPMGGTCKICTRNFELFKWRPGRGESYKRTEICRTCSEMKNICQTCILDLRFGLPSQLRDAVLSYADSKENSHGSSHQSDVTRDYKMQEYLQKPTTNVNLDESDSRLINIARTVTQNRQQDRVSIGVRSPSSLSAAAPFLTSIDSNSTGDATHQTINSGKDEASIFGHELFPQLAASEAIVQVPETIEGSNKKRKTAPGVLPPRPSGPPPSWAFRNKEEL